MIVYGFRLHIQTRLPMTGRKLDGSGTAVNSKNPSPRICAECAKTVIEWGPAGNRNEAWLIWVSATQTSGASPHECPLTDTAGVDPINVIEHIKEIALQKPVGGRECYGRRRGERPSWSIQIDGPNAGTARHAAGVGGLAACDKR
jgi:hypothetical protein